MNKETKIRQIYLVLIGECLKYCEFLEQNLIYTKLQYEGEAKNFKPWMMGVNVILVRYLESLWEADYGAAILQIPVLAHRHLRLHSQSGQALNSCWPNLRY